MVGAIVLLIREQIRQIRRLRIAPAAGPSKIAPRITGMCTVVALIIGSLDHPKRRVRQYDYNCCHKCNTYHPLCVVFLCFHYSIPPCYHSCLAGYQYILAALLLYHPRHDSTRIFLYNFTYFIILQSLLYDRFSEGISFIFFSDKFTVGIVEIRIWISSSKFFYSNESDLSLILCSMQDFRIFCAKSACKSTSPPLIVTPPPE